MVDTNCIFGKCTKEYATLGALSILCVALLKMSSLWIKWHLIYQPAYFECIEVKPHLARLTARTQPSLVTLVPLGI